MAIFLSLFVSFAIAQELPGTAWSLNPQLHFKEKTGAPKHSGSGGFSATFVQGDMELQLKGTRIENAANAKQMCIVEFTNLENLYAARGNPYEGQITDVIQCDKTYKPRPFKYKSGGAERSGLLAGANERHLVGACARDQVAYWVSYSNFYDEPSKMVIESRLFLKAPKPDAKQVSELSKKLQEVTRELLVPKPTT